MNSGVPALEPARISAASRGTYELVGSASRTAELSGRLRHRGALKEEPTTGDWVLVQVHGEQAVINEVLERKTALKRRAVGPESRSQTVAANLDVCFIVTSADRDFNLRRIERYLAAVWDGGAEPIVVLNKAELAADPGAFLAQIASVAPLVPTVLMSARSGLGLELLRGHLKAGLTFGFVGSSGVGKSSIINALQDRVVQETGRTREDGKGRHTTTRRELLLLPGRGVLIDTPGMREFGIVIEGDGLDATFAEISALARSCRFPDCAHRREPGCAVRQAVESGELLAERLDSYLRLLDEAAAAEARSSPEGRANTKRHFKAIHKSMREFSRHNPKR